MSHKGSVWWPSVRQTSLGIKTPGNTGRNPPFLISYWGVLFLTHLTSQHNALVAEKLLTGLRKACGHVFLCVGVQECVHLCMRSVLARYTCIYIHLCVHTCTYMCTDVKSHREVIDSPWCHICSCSSFRVHISGTRGQAKLGAHFSKLYTAHSSIQWPAGPLPLFWSGAWRKIAVEAYVQTQLQITHSRLWVFWVRMNSHKIQRMK